LEYHTYPESRRSSLINYADIEVEKTFTKKKLGYVEIGAGYIYKYLLCHITSERSDVFIDTLF